MLLLSWPTLAAVACSLFAVILAIQHQSNLSIPLELVPAIETWGVPDHDTIGLQHKWPAGIDVTLSWTAGLHTTLHSACKLSLLR